MPGRRRSLPSDPTQRVNCSVRCTPAWSNWVFNGARHLKLTMSDLVDKAVTDYLRRHGYEDPAPDRIPLPPPVIYPPDFERRRYE